MAIPNPGSRPNPYAGVAQQIDEPAFDFIAVTPNDNNDLVTRPRRLYIGGAGTLIVHNNDGAAVTFLGVPAGTQLNISPRRVVATGTTATGIVALI